VRRGQILGQSCACFFVICVGREGLRPLVEYVDILGAAWRAGSKPGQEGGSGPGWRRRVRDMFVELDEYDKARGWPNCLAQGGPVMQCHSVTVSQCHSVTVSHAKVSQCQGHRVTVSHCHCCIAVMVTRGSFPNLGSIRGPVKWIVIIIECQRIPECRQNWLLHGTESSGLQTKY